MIDEDDEPATQPTPLRAIGDRVRLRTGQCEDSWDVWSRRARAAGVSVDLVELGCSVLREAALHRRSAVLQVEAMVAWALAEPAAAQARWRELLDTEDREE